MHEKDGLGADDERDFGYHDDLDEEEEYVPEQSLPSGSNPQPPGPVTLPDFQWSLAEFMARGYLANDPAFWAPDYPLDEKAFAGSSAIRSCLLRGATFSCGIVQRYWCDRAFIPLLFARHVHVTGFRLYQVDLSILLRLNHLLRGRWTSAPFDLDARQLILTAGWPMTARSIPRLAESLTCLAHARFALVRANYSVLKFRLFDQLCMEGGRIRGKLSGGMLDLQGPGGDGTFLSLERRRALCDGLQTWLAGMILASKCDEPFHINTLLQHSGSSYARSAEFGRDLRRALERLQAVGIVSSWTQAPNGRLERGFVTIRKSRFVR